MNKAPASFRMLRYHGRNSSFWRTYTKTTEISRDELRGCAMADEFIKIPIGLGTLFTVMFNEYSQPFRLKIMTNAVKILTDEFTATQGMEIPINDNIIKITIAGIEILCFRQYM